MNLEKCQFFNQDHVSLNSYWLEIINKEIPHSSTALVIVNCRLSLAKPRKDVLHIYTERGNMRYLVAMKYSFDYQVVTKIKGF